MDRQSGGWKDGWADGRTDGRTDGESLRMLLCFAVAIAQPVFNAKRGPIGLADPSPNLAAIGLANGHTDAAAVGCPNPPADACAQHSCTDSSALGQAD